MEAQLVQLLQKLFPGTGQPVANGDDAAVVRTSARTAVTVDTQVAGTHFHWAWAPPARLGARLVGVTLSDLAAMGARPQTGVLSLIVPVDVPFARVAKYLQGVAQRAAVENFAIVGGDVAGGPAFAAILTAMGEAPARPLQRAAKAGDLLCVSGPVGRAGVEVRRLLGGEKFRANRWLTPPSRISLGRELANKKGVRGAMDISDGLFLDARRMADKAGLGLRINGDAIPVEPAVRKQLANVTPAQFLSAIGGGEDYELLVSVDSKALVPGLVPIGVFVRDGFTVELGGKSLVWPRAGFLH